MYFYLLITPFWLYPTLYRLFMYRFNFQKIFLFRFFSQDRPCFNLLLIFSFSWHLIFWIVDLNLSFPWIASWDIKLLCTYFFFYVQLIFLRLFALLNISSVSLQASILTKCRNNSSNHRFSTFNIFEFVVEIMVWY